MNGKGDRPRPLSVNQETFTNNWDRIFRSSVKSDIDPEYTRLLASGMFWELFPGLSGKWEEDKLRWQVAKNSQIGDTHDSPK